MGWCSDDPGHEGFTVALVLRDNVSRGSGCYRELQYPNDDTDRTDIACVQAGCECGWRSPYIFGLKAEFHPFTVWLSERDEDQVHRLWKAHIASERRAAVAPLTG